LWEHANDTSAWAINVSYEKERNRYNERQDRKQQARLPMRTIANKQAAANGKSDHETPNPNWKAVPPRSLRVSLPVQDIVHPPNGESDRRGWSRRSGTLDGEPHFGLEFRRLAVDLFKLVRIVDRIKQQPLIKILC
jgi:hypothetical protein